MTRKDYELIARAMTDAKPYGLDSRPVPGPRYNAWRDCVHKLAFDLGNDNPRFDGLRFRRACGEEV